MSEEILEYYVLRNKCRSCKYFKENYKKGKEFYFYYCSLEGKEVKDAGKCNYRLGELDREAISLGWSK